MPVGLAPIHDPAPERRIHLVVRSAMRLTAIGYEGVPDPAEHLVERSFVDSKAVVPAGEFAFPLVEVDGEPRIDVDRRERTDFRRTPSYAEQRRKLPGSSVPVPRWHHDVVEFYRHSTLSGGTSVASLSG